MNALSVFVDSDVVTSSLLSTKGASHFLLHQGLGKKSLDFFISNLSLQELKIVANRLKIKVDDLDKLVVERFKIIKLQESSKSLEQKYGKYVLDLNDTHIIAGAKESGAKFLLSYNIRHFKVDLIKRDSNVIVMTPALFLQYLRSRN